MNQSTPINKPICGAKRARGNGICQSVFVMKNGRCKKHGGKSLKGIANGTFKHGKTSKYAYLPDRLSEKVADFLNDPEIVQLKENIAVIDARLTELYQQFHESEPAFIWRDLHQRYLDWQRELAQLEKIKQMEGETQTVLSQQTLCDNLHNEFSKLLANGASEQSKADRIWSDILETTEQRRKLVESETKRIKDSQQFMTYEQFMTFCQMILLIIKNNVTDRDILMNIQNEFQQRNLITAKPNVKSED